MGWPLRPDARHPVATGIGGRRSAFFVYPRDDLAVVVLTNLAGANPEEFVAEIAGVFFPELRLANGGGLSPAANRLRLALAAAPTSAPEAVYASLRQGRKDFAVGEDELNDWGGRLLGAGRPGEALRVFLLNTRLRPDSANAWDSLGEAYEARREPADAVAAYRRSLRLDAANDHARAHLKALGAAPAP
jgi:tetratricopeptide (TPR) repeat protein